MTEAAIRTPRFGAYAAREGEIDLDALQGRLARAHRELEVGNEPSYYRRLLDGLLARPELELLALRDLDGAASEGRVRVALRHDIDLDPFSALRLAAELGARSIPGSFYLLHTGNYYGRFDGDVFVRHDNLLRLLLEIEHKSRCEVGLHVDALWLYQKRGLDGAAAVKSELAYLDRLGFRVDGTAAHNSAPVYHAENFEIFRGRARHGRRWVDKDGIRVPLQTLDEDRLGLSYEANRVSFPPDSPALDSYLEGWPADPVRDPDWMRTYLLDNPFCRWGSDYNLWLIGPDRWALAGHPNGVERFLWNAELEDVFAVLDAAPARSTAVIHIHPVYIDRPES